MKKQEYGAVNMSDFVKYLSLYTEKVFTSLQHKMTIFRNFLQRSLLQTNNNKHSTI